MTTETGKQAEAELLDRVRDVLVASGFHYTQYAEGILAAIGLSLSSLAWAASHAEEIRMLAEGTRVTVEKSEAEGVSFPMMEETVRTVDAEELARIQARASGKEQGAG